MKVCLLKNILYQKKKLKITMFSRLSIHFSTFLCIFSSITYPFNLSWLSIKKIVLFSIIHISFLSLQLSSSVYLLPLSLFAVTRASPGHLVSFFSQLQQNTKIESNKTLMTISSMFRAEQRIFSSPSGTFFSPSLFCVHNKTCSAADKKVFKYFIVFSLLVGTTRSVKCVWFLVIGSGCLLIETLVLGQKSCQD